MSKKKKKKSTKKKGVMPYDPWYHPTTIQRYIPEPFVISKQKMRMRMIMSKVLFVLMLILTLLILFLAMLGETIKISQIDNTHDSEYTSVQCQGGEN